MASYLTLTKNYDLIGSITHPKVSQKIADNITGKIAAFYFLNKLGYKEMEDGGEKYVLPVLYNLPEAQAYTGLSTLSNPELDAVTSAVYERKQLTIPIVLTGTKLLKNQGGNEDAIIDYMASQIEIAEEGMKAALAGTTYGIMSANGESDLGVTGLQNILTDSNTTGSVGNLSRASYSWWRHLRQNVATGFNTSGLVAMRALNLALSRGNEGATVCFITPTTYSNLARALTGTLTYNQPSPNTKFGDIDFENINFAGMPVVPDDGVPANRGYMLNLKYMKLLVHRDRDMAIREFISPTDQDSILARLYWAGNLVCNNLARQGQLYGLPDTWA